MPLLPWLIFITLAGACVGSFLNVVTMRLPEGKSIVTPPSACPKCGHKLAWYENVPIISWLVLRGRCRSCKAPISVQYPLVEAATALMFGGLAAIYYLTDVRSAFYDAGFAATWPALLVHLVLIAALIAATVIDARLFIIPLSIPWVATVVAVIVLPVATAMGGLTVLEGIVPTTGARGLGAALGGVGGVALAFGLLQTGLLPRSFDEMEEQVTEPEQPDQFLEHPHPRREVLKETLFVALPAVGIALGAWLAGGGQVSPTLAVLGGVLSGFLVGGALVWVTRILGTLGFGKEAMGLGDVHLLAAIGAVIGPVESVAVFFIAPFLGLVGALVTAGVQALVKREVQMIPYGPYLAAAAVVVMVFREPVVAFMRDLFGSGIV
ncbi:MAG: prepilin peptidase [Phycisphaeraceae bacterium]